MNPQSSRSSVTLGPVPAAPKPAPNPITTNMPQFGSAPGLTNSEGVPTLPPVSPGTTQPLAPAPSPAPAPAPVSAMPQYMNSSDTNMIPVVEKPIDINKVPDTPAEQYNPFSSMPGGAVPKPPKSSSGRTLNLLLGLLSALFIIAAVVFFILWQQAANSSKVVPMPSDPTGPTVPTDPENPENPSPENPENPETPEPVLRRLSCRGSEEITESEAATGMTANSSLYEVIYHDNANPTEIRITSTAEYNSPEAAAAVYAEASGETFEALSGIYGALGLNISADSFSIDNNVVSATLVVPVSNLMNPDHDVFARQLLATVVGFPSELAEDGSAITIHSDLDAVRASYESNGLVCEVIE